MLLFDTLIVVSFLSERHVGCLIQTRASWIIHVTVLQHWLTFSKIKSTQSRCLFSITRGRSVLPWNPKSCLLCHGISYNVSHGSLTHRSNGSFPPLRRTTESCLWRKTRTFLMTDFFPRKHRTRVIGLLSPCLFNLDSFSLISRKRSLYRGLFLEQKDSRKIQTFKSG